LYKARLALFAIIAPEVILNIAIDSYSSIQDTLNRLPTSFFEVRIIFFAVSFFCNISI
jgi:hypothetical protein